MRARGTDGIGSGDRVDVDDGGETGEYLQQAVVATIDPRAYAAAVLTVAELIPAARVLTYGDIAELLGCGGPRQVGRALSRSTREVPWWRVLRAGGHPPRGFALQALPHYEDEGTVLSVRPGAAAGEYRVDLRAARWWPSEEEQHGMAELGASLRHGP
jgi:alkylated DNA nucleotide flippase Atl1